MRNNLSNHWYYNFCIFLSCYFLLGLYSIAPEQSWDVYWHLRTGLDWIEKGWSPYIDHYSFTNYGNSISSAPVFFQLCISYFVIAFGEERGFYLFKLTYVFFLFIAFAVYLKKTKANSLVFFLALPIFSYFVAHRMILRPELISNVLMLVCMVLYIRAKQSFTHKELFFISLLMLVWVNYHSPIFGYIIIFGLFLDRFIHKAFLGEKSFSWGMFCFWGAVIFLVGFLNREGVHFVFSMIDFVINNKGATTGEYLPTRNFYSTNQMIHLSWALSVCVGFWSVLKKQYGFAFISMVLLYFSWSTVRLVTPVAMINVCILTYLLSQFFYKKEYKDLKPVISQLVVFVVLALAIFSFYEFSTVAINEYKYKKYKNSRLEARYPIKVASYLKKYQKEGKILNPMQTGGYFINSLSPGFKVYIDGRTNILHPLSMLDHYKEMMSNSSIMRKEINQYDVDYILIENRPWFISLVYGMNDMKLNYVDKYYILFSKKSAENSFPVASLMAVIPSCWNDSLIKNINEEYQRAKKIFTDDKYLIVDILNILNAYSLSPNKKEFIRQLENTSLSDQEKRLLGYLAIKNELYNISLQYMSNIVINQRYDIFLMAYAKVMMGKYEDAEKGLLSYTNNQVFYFMQDINTIEEGKRITPLLTSFLLSMVDEMSKNYPLQYFSSEDFQLLKEKHGQFGGTYKDVVKFGDPSAMFCQELTGSEYAESRHE